MTLRVNLMANVDLGICKALVFVFIQLSYNLNTEDNKLKDNHYIHCFLGFDIVVGGRSRTNMAYATISR